MFISDVPPQTLSAPTGSWHSFPVQPQLLHWQMTLRVPAGPMPSLPQLSPFPNLDETHLVCRFCLPDWLKKEPRTQLRSLEELTPCPEGYTLTSCKKKTGVKRSPKFFLNSFLRWPIPRYSFRTVCLKAVASAVTSLCFSSFYALLVMTLWLLLPIIIST